MPTSTRYPVRPCCPVSGGLKPSPTFRFIGCGALYAPYRTIVTCTGLRILRLRAPPSAQNDMVFGTCRGGYQLSASSDTVGASIARPRNNCEAIVAVFEENKKDRLLRCNFVSKLPDDQWSPLHVFDKLKEGALCSLFLDTNRKCIREICAATDCRD